MDDIERDVRDFIQQELPYLRPDIDLSTDIIAAAKIDGDDVSELIEEFADQFEVDLFGYRWWCHHGPEGCFLLFWAPFSHWFYFRQRIPIRLSDLVRAARTRKWCIEYPEAAGDPITGVRNKERNQR